MYKISIVGSNSYIAKNMIFLLENNKNYEIKLYDIQDQSSSDYNYTKIDFCDSEALDNMDFDCDAFIFFTGKTGTVNGFEEYNAFIDINEKSLLAFLTAYVRAQSKARIVFPSTRLVYKGNELSLLNEDAVKEFKTLYAINKFSCESILEAYHNTFDVQYTILRICVPYGNLSADTLSYGTMQMMLRKAQANENLTLYKGAEYKRTFTHIEDLCNTITEAAISQKTCNDVYNVGGETLSLYDAALQIADIYGVGIDYVEYPAMAKKLETGSTVFASDKLDAVLQYKRKHCFSDWLKGNGGEKCKI